MRLSSSKPIESCSVLVSEPGRALRQEPTSPDGDAVMSSFHPSFPRSQVFASRFDILHPRISISTQHHKNLHGSRYSTENTRPAGYFTTKTKHESVLTATG